MIGRVVGALFALALACGAPPGRPEEPASLEPAPVERASSLDPASSDSIAAHLTLPDTESAPEYASAIARGHAIMSAFAVRNGWSVHARERTFDRVEVFPTREALWRAVLLLYDAPDDTAMPGQGPVAGIEGRILFSVTHDEYARAHPEYAAQPEAMARLYAHEMIHRLHVRVLEGDDDAMGPRWFFEGLAVIGAGQDYDLGHLAYESAGDALAGAHQASEPELAYRRYAAALRHFLGQHTLPSLVARAGDDDFEAWLRDSDAAPR